MNTSTQMLATLFDFPFEERTRLTYWSDLAAGAPETSGGNVDMEERFAGMQVAWPPSRAYGMSARATRW